MCAFIMGAPRSDFNEHAYADQPCPRCGHCPQCIHVADNVRPRTDCSRIDVAGGRAAAARSPLHRRRAATSEQSSVAAGASSGSWRGSDAAARQFRRPGGTADGSGSSCAVARKRRRRRQFRRLELPRWAVLDGRPTPTVTSDLSTTCKQSTPLSVFSERAMARCWPGSPSTRS